MLSMAYILKENYVANRKISVGTLKFDLKLSKKATKNTRAIPTVKSEKMKTLKSHLRKK